MEYSEKLYKTKKKQGINCIKIKTIRKNMHKLTMHKKIRNFLKKVLTNRRRLAIIKTSKREKTKKGRKEVPEWKRERKEKSK